MSDANTLHTRLTLKLLRTRMMPAVSQGAAAKACGVSIDTIRRWEAGETGPDPREVHRLAAFYGVGDSVVSTLALEAMSAFRRPVPVRKRRPTRIASRQAPSRRKGSRR